MRDQSSAPPDGIVIAAGYGLKIYVDRGHLVVHDGVGRRRQTLRLARATSGLERLVVIGHDGYVTLEALRWIRDVGASFIQIGRDSEVIAMSSAERFHKTTLRRAQGEAATSQAGLTAMRQLAEAKLQLQLERAERLEDLWPPKPNGGRGRAEVGSIIRKQLKGLPACKSLEEIRARESVAGRWYWQTLAALPVTFDAAFRRSVPAHWHTAGSRGSLPTGFKSARKAATPFQALVNYAYAILETEAKIVLQAHGFDPGMGILHTDKRYRGSLAHDLMEPVRPVVDGFVIDLVATHQLARGEVYETREGVCRLGPPMARRLVGWAPGLRPVLTSHASRLAAVLLGEQISAPARRRSAALAGKGSKRRGGSREVRA